jgi:hypothetical protein
MMIARRVAAGFVIGFPVLYGALSLAVGQDANWDLENYHWYNAFAFLNAIGERNLLVSQTPSFYNPLLDVPFFVAASDLPARLVGFGLGWLQGLNGVLLFFLAHGVIRGSALSRVALSALTAAVGMLGGGTLGELGATFWDNVVSLGVFGGLLILLPYAFRPGRKAGWAVLAGLTLGAAAGLKQPHLLYCGGVGLAILFLPGSLGRRLTLAGCLAAGGVAGIALTSGFWMWHLWAAYGNPLFPYYNQIFQSPFAALNRDFRDAGMMPKTLWQRLFYPIFFTLDSYRVGEVAQRGPAILAWYLLLPVAVVLALGRRMAGSGGPARIADRAGSRFVLAATGLSYIAWLQMFSIYRYLTPLEMLAPLGVLLALDHLPGTPRLRQGLTAGLLILCAATGVRGDWGRVPWGDRYVEITPPPLPRGAMALMAGYESVGFTATALPADAPVLRIQSNFIHPGDTPSRFTAMMQGRIAAHDGPFVVIYLRKDRADADQALADFGLKENPESCREIANSLDDRGILMCDVTRAGT